MNYKGQASSLAVSTEDQKSHFTIGIYSNLERTATLLDETGIFTQGGQIFWKLPSVLLISDLVWDVVTWAVGVCDVNCLQP